MNSFPPPDFWYLRMKKLNFLLISSIIFKNSSLNFYLAEVFKLSFPHSNSTPASFQLKITSSFKLAFTWSWIVEWRQLTPRQFRFTPSFICCTSPTFTASHLHPQIDTSNLGWICLNRRTLHTLHRRPQLTMTEVSININQFGVHYIQWSLIVLFLVLVIRASDWVIMWTIASPRASQHSRIINLYRNTRN